MNKTNDAHKKLYANRKAPLLQVFSNSFQPDRKCCQAVFSVQMTLCSPYNALLLLTKSCITICILNGNYSERLNSASRGTG